MKILVDTDVVLDVLLDRKRFVNSAGQIFSMVEAGKITGVLSATTITTIYYLAVKVVGPEIARLEIKKLFKLFEIAPVNRAVLEDAANLNFTDFEDGVLYEAARYVGAQAIITRNISDFKRAKLSVYSPEEFLKSFIKTVILGTVCQ